MKRICVVCGNEFEGTELQLLCKNCAEKNTSFALDTGDTEVVEVETESKSFTKFDKGKLQWSLMPFRELEDTVKILQLGAKKYSIGNWQKCDNLDRYKDALMRHVIAYMKGEKNDKESGLSHLAHAVCNCLFLEWFDNEEKKKDDEYTKAWD